MSLAQRVTSSGRDFEGPHLENVFLNDAASNGYGTVNDAASLRHKSSYQRSLRRVISYDAIANPDEPSRSLPAGSVRASCSGSRP